MVDPSLQVDAVVPTGTTDLSLVETSVCAHGVWVFYAV